MLFNSVEFIFGFLPVTVLLFFGLARRSHGVAAGWLALASLFFYGWWNWVYVPLLMASTAFNYLCGVNLARRVRAGQTRAAGGLLAFAVTANLLLLGYYKYANVFLDIWRSLGGEVYASARSSCRSASRSSPSRRSRSWSTFVVGTPRVQPDSLRPVRHLFPT
jgi:D-alanyl-lipoteichoic acid acyltransferase DltB (MBOAT superfamily)